jgi:L-aminopeptidase/D-esterase-like protein
MLHDALLDALFQAVADSVEQAILACAVARHAAVWAETGTHRAALRRDAERCAA